MSAADQAELDAAVFSPEAPEQDAAAAPADPWLARRAHGFGGSDLAALMLVLGVADPATAPTYLRAAAKVMRKGGRVGPRLLLEKAGFARPLAGNESMRIGSAREPELLDAWRATLGDSLLDADSVQHASALPREVMPLVDRECPRLAVTPDAWCRNIFGGLVVVECKCSRYDGADLPWYWRVQAMAQIAVMGAEEGVVVLGRGWSRAMDAAGEVVAWHVERDEREIERLRGCVGEGWRRVVALREMGT